MSWKGRDALLWTDIHASRLWIHDAAGTRWLSLPDRLASFAPCASGNLLLGFATGLFAADGAVVASAPDGSMLPVTWLADVERDMTATRLNDGRTDRAGNFVFGTMNEEEGHAPIGSFYQWSTQHGLRRLDLPLAGIANSIAFSPGGETMYFCDSPTRRIMQCRYDSTAAGVSDVRTFATLANDEGEPDGSIVDAEGCLWNAAWGSGMVRRYRPDGTVERAILVPAKNPTCPVFGGASMQELFVTTARQGMTAAELERVPEAGGIYRAGIDDVPGLADTPFDDVR